MKQPRNARVRAWITRIGRRFRVALTVVSRLDILAPRSISAVLCGVAFLGASQARASGTPAAQDSLVAVTLTGLVVRGELPALRWGNLSDVSADLQRTYASRGWAPLWSRDGMVLPQARQLVTALTQVTERGLAPTDYDLPRLMRLASAPLASVEARAEFDLTLSVATLRALRALYFGRVAASDARPTLHIARDSVALDAALLQLGTGASPDSPFDAAEPRAAPYQRLKRALAVFRARNAEDDSVAQVRTAQILVTMERWRWLPRTSEMAPVVVNIPAYSLQVLSDDGTPSPLAMDVVVGNTDRHQTPIFADTIRYIEFAPYWNVPLSIAKAELIPRALRDPHILTVNNYEIVNQRGQTVVPTVAMLKRVLGGTAYIRQLPGGSNSLGRVKFMFPNAYDVYLHDSPVRADFARARRDQSHGCIRLADPRAFASWLLRDQPMWTLARIDSLMHRRTPTRVALARGVPVYLFYATAVASEDGGVQFHDDIYGYDAALMSQLARGYPYRTLVAEGGIAGPGGR